MRIVDIRETAIPLKSKLANSSFDFTEMTTSVVAVITDVVSTLDYPWARLATDLIVSVISLIEIIAPSNDAKSIVSSYEDSESPPFSSENF